MDKDFSIKLYTEEEYTECKKWFEEFIKEDILKLCFVKGSWEYFQWEPSPKHWSLLTNSGAVKIYSWKQFLTQVASEFSGVSSNDIFVINKYASELNAPNKLIPRYCDGEGRKEAENYNIRDCSSATKIITVNKDYFELNYFGGRGWFKKSDVLGEVPKTTPQFEVGKWYWYYEEKRYLIKFKKIDGLTVQCSEYIRLANSNHDSSGSSCGYVSDYKEIIEATPEEYSQYLPEGHPDKIDPKPVFEVGKWYKYNGWYLKYSATAGGIWKSSEEINERGVYSAGSGNFGGESIRKVLLTDLTEIQKYLPDGHPDKITPKYNFTVGEWYYDFAFQKTKAKFLRLDGETFIGSEWISDTGKHYAKEFSGNCRKAKRISKEAIQSYLPNGHPDKIASKVEFVVGKWYEYYEKDRYLFKFQTIINSTHVECSEHISLFKNKHYNSGGAVGRIIDYKSAIEVSSDVLSKYLPDGHPDKWISCSLSLNFVIPQDGPKFSISPIKAFPVFVEPEIHKTKEDKEKPLSLISSKKLKIDFVI